MTEYRMTDGETIIIEIARTENEARAAGAKRLGCEADDFRVLDTKRRPLTQREVREQAYWEKYADYLIRMDRKAKK